jgi:hypothetical protein
MQKERSYALKYSTDIHNYNTRNKQNLHLERVEKNWDKQTFGCHAINDWNSACGTPGNRTICIIGN